MAQIPRLSNREWESVFPLRKKRSVTVLGIESQPTQPRKERPTKSAGVGDFIYVNGVRHITEDYLAMYIFSET